MTKQEVVKELEEYRKSPAYAYNVAYEVVKKNIPASEMTCGGCGGVLKVSPMVKNAHFNRAGVVSFEVDTINYCNVCSN